MDTSYFYFFNLLDHVVYKWSEQISLPLLILGESKRFIFSSLSVMIALGFSQLPFISFIRLRKFLFIHNLLRIWSGTYVRFVKCLFGIYWTCRVVFLTSFVNMVNYIDWFSNVKNTFPSWNKPLSILCIVGLNLFRIFAYLFMRVVDLYFSFLE